MPKISFLFGWLLLAAVAAALAGFTDSPTERSIGIYENKKNIGRCEA